MVNDFDNRNLLIARRYFGIDGKQIAARDTGIAQFRWSYDERGNMEWERDFGADGAPALNKTTGAAAIKNVYDEHGDRTELDYFGVDGRPSSKRRLCADQPPRSMSGEHHRAGPVRDGWPAGGECEGHGAHHDGL